MDLNYLKHEDMKMTEEEVRVRIDEIYKSGRWLQLKKDILHYYKLREDIIRDMENHTDPVFKRFLNIYKSTMTVKEFEQNRLKIYAICNRHAMFSCLPVDVLLKMGNKRRRHN